MSTNIRIDEDQHSPIGRVRDALGAITPASTPARPAAFSLDCDADDHWRLRLEGALLLLQFASHEATASFMRSRRHAARSFRLSIVGADGARGGVQLAGFSPRTPPAAS